MFVSTLFSIFNLEENEVKAVNLFHRTNMRRELELVASKVVTDTMKINSLLLKSFKIYNNKGIGKHPDLEQLQKQIILNLKYVKNMKRQLDYYKLETLYFEDDMLTKIDLIRVREKEMLTKVIQAEKLYKEIFLDSNILDIKSLTGGVDSNGLPLNYIAKNIVVGIADEEIYVCRRVRISMH